MFEPTYTAALDRLQGFLPNAGRSYAEKRNYDDRANVSTLSPYIRHRIITEEDVLKATLQRHSATAAEKFIQEVYWRTYWKGWLELRPAVWDDYKATLQGSVNRVQTESGLRRDWEAACKGETGIACFDHWAQELVETGYLHNHARMWFASIWIFTLRLPWALGADFFLRHLLDGDPASNTLSWRWVAGLQTIGKTYLARHDNIAKYTKGRFHPEGLAIEAVPLEGRPHPPRGAVPQSDPIKGGGSSALLITEEDLSPGWLLDRFAPEQTIVVQTTKSRSPWQVAPQVNDFVAGALNDCVARYGAKLRRVSYVTPANVEDWCAQNNVRELVSSYIPVGPTRDALSHLPLSLQVRKYDADAWPHATHGFFRFKEKIPSLLGRLKGLELT
ncbi:FAD-binding domain-containing protein [Yoonia litorea]|uniref:Deoxyribodipyrimidine photo-lyase n=1 Tax=Yoonia litorea TaxID=1123755 RepID=A0A1I6MES4_9RHOB|nr:FAD-binding domain-containing protein [Yoonia litorea]SFS14239.1 deoxyribodipyrimidine photo-lyase [Yoonia litorea]